ncbi:MAG: MFS transporter, partial [Gammaproteobacteria bacterium]|nr:MFS transporter [Gammaproteobacteria bacterium]
MSGHGHHGHGGHGHHGHGDQATAGPGAEPAGPYMTPDKFFLLFGLITYGIGQSVLYIVFPPLVKEIGLTLQQYGWIMSISNLVLALSAIYWGRRSDRVGRKPTLLLGLFGYAVGTLGVALALEWGVRGSPAPWVLFGVILFARMVYGALASAINPAASGYMADTTSRANRARGMALLGMTSGIGTILGPVLGGALAFISVIFPMYAAIVLALLAMLMLAILLKEPERAPAPEGHELKKLSPFDPRVRAFLFLFFCFWMFFTMIQVIIAFLLADQIGIEGPGKVAQATSTALMSMAICATFMQLVVIQKMNITPRTMLRLGLPAFALAMGALLLATNIYMVWVSFSLFGIALALSNPGITGGASLMVEPHEQGALGGLFSAAPILGMAVGPVLGSTLYAQVSMQMPMIVGVVAFVLL